MRSSPRILLIGPELILQWTDSVARALKGVGCSVETVFYNRLSRRRSDIGERRPSFVRRIRRMFPDFPPVLLERYAGWRAAWASRAVLEAARRFKPDLVLVLKGESLRPGALRRIKAETDATVAVWWVDHPFMNAETRRSWHHVPGCVPVYDHCFVFDRSYEEPLRAAGGRSISFLPCAADQGLYRPQAVTDDERARYGTLVSLVGVYSGHRARIVEAVSLETGLGVWGPRWREFLAARNGGHTQVFRGESLLPAEACKVYNAGAVNLNTHHLQSRRGGLNTRAFEIPAAGAFELTDYVPEMESLLEPGREVAVYRSPEEAADLARFYVKAEDQRRRIAEAGYRRVLAEHTYRHRMQTLLEVVAK